MRKIILLFVILSLIGAKAYTQVTIGAGSKPNPDALLDLHENVADNSSSRGLLMPRVALISTILATPMGNHVAGMTVYNTAVSEPDEINYVSPGFYYNNGRKWERLNLGTSNWFYMPPIVFDTSLAATGVVRDLYAEFSKQFLGLEPTTFVKSIGAPATIPYVPAADELYYYITYYDPAVFSDIIISEEGVMTYNVTPAATETSYINIVFVVK